jgi:DNA-binding SARP family transcriptional activator
MPGPTTLLLFGEPRLAFGETDGFGDRDIPAGGKRLVAYAALHRGRLDRRHAAGTLWPSCDDVRAAGNLRSALWRLRAGGLSVLEADKQQVWLRAEVTVDADQVATWALRLIDGGPASDRDEATWHRSRPGLLPGWPEEWVGPYRERLRQRVLHAMEARACSSPPSRNGPPRTACSTPSTGPRGGELNRFLGSAPKRPAPFARDAGLFRNEEGL